MEILQQAQDYYESPTTSKHAFDAFEELTYQPAFHDIDEDKIAKMSMLFARDCKRDGLTPFEIDHAVAAWRRKPTAFVPSYGQFLEIAKQANTSRKYMEYFVTCDALINPKYGAIT